MSSKRARVERVRARLQQAGVAAKICELTSNTATAAQAAAALGCTTAEIAKSVVFCDAAGRAVVAVLCGDDRVDAKKLAQAAGGKVGKADADFVKAQCGFEIGGVAPLAHTGETLVVLDNRLQRFATIWAAAGSAYAVFGAAPQDLAQAAGARFADIAQSPA